MVREPHVGTVLSLVSCTLTNFEQKKSDASRARLEGCPTKHVMPTRNNEMNSEACSLNVQATSSWLVRSFTHVLSFTFKHGNSSVTKAVS